MPFTKILCPIDFSPGSKQALHVAGDLAARASCELVVAHVWQLPSSTYALEYPWPAEVAQNLIDDATRELAKAESEALAPGVAKVSSILLSGTPSTEIVALLEQQAFDLCVVGTHGRTGLARVLLGSVAEKVVRHSPCPVLAVHPGNAPRPFTHILVPTDFSASAEDALGLALELVHPEGTVTLFHSIEIPVAYSGEVPEGLGTDLDARGMRALEQTAEVARRRTSARVATRTRIGTAGAETLHVLERDPQIDLVVIGSHGRTGIKRVLLGSVAEKVVRHAACPVLVARKSS